MLPPRLSPLQSRLLAYIVASYFLLVASTCFGSFANAAELQTAANHDDQPTLHAPLHEQLAYVQDDTQDNEESGGYAPDFNYFDRSILGRQAPQVNELLNNEKKEMDISPGNTVYFTLKKRNSRNIREDGRALDALEARGIGNASGDDKNGDIATNEQDDVSDDNDGHELRKRQAGSQIWITANTCRQPLAMENITQTLKDHPQLVMYISADSRNQKPGPASTDHLATDPTGVLFDSGYANFTLQADSDVYIGLSAPTLPKELIGTWHFELAASFDGPYHSYNGSNPFLFKIDSDSESALFVTYGLSDSNRSDVADRWRENDPMRMYAFAAGNGTGGNGSRITGLEHSFCALKDLFNETSQLNSTTSITTQFGGGLPKSRFHISGLESNQTYNGFLVVEGSKDALELPGVGTVRGGGKVFQQFTWTTKADDSCQVLFDLPFCDSVAYAVPSSSQYKRNDQALKDLYDNQAKSYYLNFTRSLAQVACDTTSEAQYSLARTCTDCANDYKTWLCSVLIPRCEDWSANKDGLQPWLQPRNVNPKSTNQTLSFNGTSINSTMQQRYSYNSSRNPLIDTVIQPGPYLELKPCEDLCFDIVRSCPAQLGFSCPNSPAREMGYGRRDPADQQLWCNFPGAVVKLNNQSAAVGLRARVVSVVLSVLMVGVVVLF